MAIINEDKLKEIISTAKELLKDHQKFEQLRNKRMMSVDISRKQLANINNKTDTYAESINMKTHELHCLAVEFGIADRQEDRYTEKEFTNYTGWYNSVKTFREPRV